MNMFFAEFLRAPLVRVASQPDIQRRFTFEERTVQACAMSNIGRERSRESSRVRLLLVNQNNVTKSPWISKIDKNRYPLAPAKQCLPAIMCIYIA